MAEALQCRKCGSTKMGSAHNELLSKLARALGYRLKRCGGCHRLRLLPAHPKSDPRAIRQPVDSPDVAAKTAKCPYCGSADTRRSRRRWYDRLMKRPRMARCRACRRRFRRRQAIPSDAALM